MRVVLDTNIFVSMLMGGPLRKINHAWRTGKFTLIVSDEIVSEYLEVLQRPKLHLSLRAISIAIGRIQRKAEFVLPLQSVTAVEDDPSDNKFLEALLAGKADYLVSGDKHLLDLKTFRGIPIITARQFINRL